MTTKITARVQRWKSEQGTYSWATNVWAVDEDGMPQAFMFTNYSQSWPEAMQVAYKMRATLDRNLMDEVHDSRATRRKKAAA